MSLQKNFHISYKYTRWLELYLDKKNIYGLATYRNQTLAACYAYNYDPQNRKEYLIAAQIAHKNINKYKQTASNYYEHLGITMGNILNMYLKLMIARKDINMLYSLAYDMNIPLPEYINVTNPKNNYCPGCHVNNINKSQSLNVDQIIRLGDIPSKA